MGINEKHDRWMTGLDNAYEELMEAREREILQDEIIRDWILEDAALFQRMAQKYLDDPVNREGFLDWAIEEVKREREPQFETAWQDEPHPQHGKLGRGRRGESNDRQGTV